MPHVKLYIQTAELSKGLRPPKTTAEKQKDEMLTGAGLKPMPLKPSQAAGGAKCGKCGHHHRAGNICSFDKSEDILDILKANTGSRTMPGKMAAGTDKKTTNLSTGIPGHKGGNPYHDGSGRFTTKENAVSRTTSVGEGAEPTGKGDEDAGQGRGSHVQDPPKDKANTELAQGSGQEDLGATGAASPGAVKQGKRPVQDDTDLLRQMEERAKFHEAKQEAFDKNPESFASGTNTPRAERSNPTISTKQPDPYDVKREAFAKEHGERAAKWAKVKGKHPDDERTRAEIRVNNAFHEAKRRGMSPDQVGMHNLGLLADAYTNRGQTPKKRNQTLQDVSQTQQDMAPSGQGADTILAPNDSSTQKMDTAPTQMDMQPTQMDTAPTQMDMQPTGQGADTILDMIDGRQSPQATPTGSGDSGGGGDEPPKGKRRRQKAPPGSELEAVQKRAEYQREYDRARKLGFPHEIAHAAANTAAGTSYDVNENRVHEVDDAQIIDDAPVRPDFEHFESKKKYNKVYNDARKNGLTHEQAHAAANQFASANFELGPDTWGKPAAQSNTPAAMVKKRETYQKTYDKARKLGFSHEQAHAAANEEAGHEFEDTGPPPDKGQEGKAGKQAKGPGIPFSQMYGAGAAMGSAMTQEGSGVVSPAAAFSAQRAHQLLNPDLRPHTAPTMAHRGQGTRGADYGSYESGKANLAQPSYMKSLLDLLEL